MLSILLYTPALYTTASRDCDQHLPIAHLQDWSQGVPTMKRRKEIKLSYGFSSNHVWLWELDYKRGWVLKNWSFWTVVLEKTLEIRLVSKEIKPVNPKGDQPLILIGRTDAETEGPILWPPDAKRRLNGKDCDAGKKMKAKGEWGNRGWDGSTASPIQWNWI